jgi:type I site-specific restriction endonuclease
MPQTTKGVKYIIPILKAQCGLGTSTRADGDLQERTDESGSYQWVIPDKYRFITLDCTADPSTFGAYPKDIQDNVARAVAEQKFKSPETKAAILESLTKSPVASEALKSLREDGKAEDSTKPPASIEERENAQETPNARDFRRDVLEATLRAHYEKAVELLTSSRRSFARDIQEMTGKLQACQAGHRRLTVEHRALQERFGIVAKAAKRLDEANR